MWAFRVKHSTNKVNRNNRMCFFLALWGFLWPQTDDFLTKPKTSWFRSFLFFYHAGPMYRPMMVISSSSMKFWWSGLNLLVQIWISCLLATYGGALLMGSCKSTCRSNPIRMIWHCMEYFLAGSAIEYIGGTLSSFLGFSCFFLQLWYLLLVGTLLF